MISGKKILITGNSGLAGSLEKLLGSTNTVTCLSRKQGYDIKDIAHWFNRFDDHDIMINNAYQDWCQVEVLEHVWNKWANDAARMIVNIGSTASDYRRTETEKDAQYWPYRLHKQSLQACFQKIVRLGTCDVKLINPGPIDTKMISHLDCAKMSPDWLAEKIIWIMQNPEIKRVDLWK
jgi:hypothetical protein